MDDHIMRVKALSHPLRMGILENVYRAQSPMPIKEVAEILNEVPAKLHYHFKQLEAAGFLEVVDTREINGITERFYGPTGTHVDLSLSMKDNREAALAALPIIERKALQAIRRLNYLTPENAHTGLGMVREIYLPPDQAIIAKQALLDFFEHKSTTFPKEANPKNGEPYDLVVIMVPKQKD